MKKYNKRKKGYYKKKKQSKKMTRIMDESIILLIFGFLYLNQDKSIKVPQYVIYCERAIIGILITVITYEIICICVKKYRYLHSSLNKIDHFTGVEFEEYLKAHFQKLGYHVQLTSTTGDYGIDLICTKPGDRFCVQAKRYQGTIGVAAIQQVISGCAYYGIQKGIVITNSYFTKNAKELAQKTNIELWDRNVINKKFKISEKK